MVEHKEAVALAKERWSEVDYYEETENAFIFSKYGDTNIGGCSPVVVLKETGECINLPAYLCEGLNTPTIKEGKI